ncbi:MAG: hypothetical protein KGH60_03800 [Candidatus Micrarchaeota archaeon]|nr:hypothetical protein [Candidatus Micrarchaeota archaeon]
MKKDEEKILSYISDRLGSGRNILEMSKGINQKYGNSYYPNIYNAIKKLEKKGIIDIEREGNNKLISINIKNPLSFYYLSEIESIRNQRTTIRKEILDGLSALPQTFDILSMCSLDTKKHLKLNRLELLFLIRQDKDIDRLTSSLIKMETDYGIKIDPIILTPESFIKIMKSEELDMLKDLILDREILYNSDGFWGLIRQSGIGSRYKLFGMLPYDIPRSELAYNYSRLGYRLNEELKPADRISAELTIFSMSINKEIRIRYGAIIILHKNIENINLAYLYYLYKRYDKLSAFKGILLSLDNLTDLKGDTKLAYYITLIREAPEAYDQKMIKRYIKLYD